jgi:hypothetical protein
MPNAYNGRKLENTLTETKNEEKKAGMAAKLKKQ